MNCGNRENFGDCYLNDYRRGSADQVERHVMKFPARDKTFKATVVFVIWLNLKVTNINRRRVKFGTSIYLRVKLLTKMIKIHVCFRSYYYVT